MSNRLIALKHMGLIFADSSDDCPYMLGLYQGQISAAFVFGSDQETTDGTWQDPLIDLIKNRVGDTLPEDVWDEIKGCIVGYLTSLQSLSMNDGVPL